MNAEFGDDFDTLVCLLSADWAARINQQQLDVSDEQFNKVKLAARAAVKTIFTYSSYKADSFLEVDYSLDRKKKTWKALEESLVEPFLIQVVKGFLLKDVGGSEHIENASETVFQMLLEDGEVLKSELLKDEFHDNEIRMIQGAISDSAVASDIDLEKLDLNSASSWDDYLKSLSPETPTYLSDYIELKMTLSDPFRVFWLKIQEMFHQRQRKALISALAAEFEVLTGNECNIPSWLD